MVMARKQNENLQLKIAQSRLADVMGDIARFDNSYRTFDGKLVRSGRVVVLRANGKTARVVARGPAGVSKDEISLSSEIRDRLNLSSGQKATFTIAKANWIDDFLWAWDATDAMPRVAARLGVISVILGLTGLILGIASAALTFPSVKIPCLIAASLCLAALFFVIGYCRGAKK